MLSIYSTKRECNVHMRIGRFCIAITVDKSKRLTPPREYDYSGKALLAILEVPHIPDTDETSQEQAEFIIDYIGKLLAHPKREETTALLPHIACFGVENLVLVTPDTLVRAIQWCQKNQDFMKSPEGI